MAAALKFYRQRMFRLIQSDLAAARKDNARHAHPSLFFYRRTSNVLRFKHRDRGIEVIAHQVQNSAEKFTAFMFRIRRFRWMDRSFRRWQSEDEPSPAGVHRGKIHYVTKKRAVFIRMFAIQQDVRANDHGRNCSATLSQDFADPIRLEGWGGWPMLYVWRSPLSLVGGNYERDYGAGHAALGRCLKHSE